MMLAEVERLATPQVEWSVLLPVLILLGGALVLMVVGALTPRRPKLPWHAGLTVALALAAIVSSVFLWWRVRDDGPISAVSDAVVVDGLSLYLGIAILCAVVLAALLTHGYLQRERLESADPYVLMLLSAAGGLVMVGANDLLVLFLGLEILSIAVYVLAGIHVRRARSGEAALKYFVLGAFSSAFFLYGTAMLYGYSGTVSLPGIAEALTAKPSEASLVTIGVALLLVGLLFKIAAVPFHQWTPDVYQGAPTAVTGFMAATVKIAAFGALLRVLYVGLGGMRWDWEPMLWIIAILTMLVGSIVAITQTDIKRMLAYSSIAQAGFILVGVVAVSREGLAASMFYLIAYAFTTIGAFAIVSMVRDASGEATHLSKWAGLGKKSPLVAGIFAIFMLALAGIPLTSGFIAKFGVFTAAIESGATWLVIVAVVASLIAAFFYARVIVLMFFSEPTEETASVVVPSAFTTIALAAGATVTIVLGIVPQPVLELVSNADVFIR